MSKVQKLVSLSAQTPTTLTPSTFFTQDITTNNVVALPESREEILAELQQAKLLREINDEVHVYLVDGSKSHTIMREIGRLREIAFQAVGEGTGKLIDVDGYDQYYQQIVLWHTQDKAIIGGYRVALANQVISELGIEGLYNHRLFEFHSQLLPKLKQGIELGRSFVNPEHWGRRNLDYLWMGIGAVLVEHPEVRYLFGAVSISDDFPHPAKLAIAHFYQAYFGQKTKLATARNVFQITGQNPFKGNDYSTEFKQLKSILAQHQVTIPPLYKHYGEIAEQNGVSVLGFNVDEYFGSCVDGLMLVDKHLIKPKKAQRYIG
jgi:hypothetical protein